MSAYDRYLQRLEDKKAGIQPVLLEGTQESLEQRVVRCTKAYPNISKQRIRSLLKAADATQESMDKVMMRANGDKSVKLSPAFIDAFLEIVEAENDLYLTR